MVRYPFAIPISQFTTKGQFTSLLLKRLHEGKQTTIATLNPEIALCAHRDKEFHTLLSRMNFLLTDGVGLAIAARLFGLSCPRITGSDALQSILSYAHAERKIVAVIGGNFGCAHAASVAWKKLYSQATFIPLFSDRYVRVDTRGKLMDADEQDLHTAITKTKPDILIAGFGAPKQEFFISHVLSSYKQIILGIGVGGLLDVVSGRLRPTPVLFSRFGVEWFWRLLQEPKRFTRILNAVIVFPIRVLWYKFFHF